MKPKIYIFMANPFGPDCAMIAVAEDGEEVAAHVSSTVDWGKVDMGLGASRNKHDLYAAKYPDGYELEWVEDWRDHPVLLKLAERNKAPKH